MGNSQTPPPTDNNNKKSQVEELKSICYKGLINYDKLLYIKELYPGGAKRIPLINCYEVSKGVCKITYKDKLSSGTGFFLNNFSNDHLYGLYLITNCHVISKEIVDSDIPLIIEIYDNKIYELKLKKGYIKFYEDPIDIAIIEISDLKELCNNVKFLTIDLNYKKGYNIYLNSDIYLLGYPLGKTVEYSPGKIKSISKGEFEHNCDTDLGSSGSPILLNGLVIGIHKAGNREIGNIINLGSFIGNIIEEIKNKNEIYNHKITQNPINYSTIKSQKIKYSNVIIAEYNITPNDINQKIRIINSYESHERELQNYKFEDNLRNEEDIKECKIEIEEKIIPFRYFHIFNKSGSFQIKFIFHKIPNNLVFIFSNCKKLTKVDLSNLNTKNVNNLTYMFYGCSSLAYLDLYNINTKNVGDMSYMFYECSSLSNLDLSSFNTNIATNMSDMFYGCSSLTNLDLSSFNTENVTNMSDMFYECSSLSNLDLSNFNTKKVTNMSYMFYGCTSLIKLKLFSFNTKNVTNMSSMFFGCSSLSDLNLSNFIIKNAIDISYMFSGCSSLFNLDLSNFNTKNVKNISNIFYGCKNLQKTDIICNDENLMKMINI